MEYAWRWVKNWPSDAFSRFNRLAQHHEIKCGNTGNIHQSSSPKDWMDDEIFRESHGLASGFCGLKEACEICAVDTVVTSSSGAECPMKSAFCMWRPPMFKKRLYWNLSLTMRKARCFNKTSILHLVAVRSYSWTSLCSAGVRRTALQDVNPWSRRRLSSMDSQHWSIEGIWRSALCHTSASPWLPQQ